MTRFFCFGSRTGHFGQSLFCSAVASQKHLLTHLVVMLSQSCAWHFEGSLSHLTSGRIAHSVQTERHSFNFYSRFYSPVLKMFSFRSVATTQHETKGATD